jgi:hypothetical protein
MDSLSRDGDNMMKLLEKPYRITPGGAFLLGSLFGT